MDTQTIELLNYLKTHKGITQHEAMIKLGIGRLSARIFDLRHAGYDIKTEMIPVRNRHNKTSHVAWYRLEVAA